VEDVKAGGVVIGDGHPLVLIGGPCVLEDSGTALETARELKRLCEGLGMPFVFKSSFEKDNRSSEQSYRGPGLEPGLAILERVKTVAGVPVTSDVHRVADVERAARVLDIVQVPAFLCQQTSLLLAVAAAGRPVNLKKGQFLSPDAMSGPVDKVRSTGNRQVLVTERGACFGYNHLIADMASLKILRGFGCPVLFDATHVVRNYGIPSADPRGGNPDLVPLLVRAAAAAGCDGLFLETHPEPSRARCDASSMIPLRDIGEILRQAKAIHDLTRTWRA
jgi:2-dehydro-3-deoxyphosphooctonate aldolase (KDO 8-P synthase)